jgi:hypothetical protein
MIVLKHVRNFPNLPEKVGLKCRLGGHELHLKWQVTKIVQQLICRRCKNIFLWDESILSPWTESTTQHYINLDMFYKENGNPTVVNQEWLCS